MEIAIFIGVIAIAIIISMHKSHEKQIESVYKSQKEYWGKKIHERCFLERDITLAMTMEIFVDKGYAEYIGQTKMFEDYYEQWFLLKVGDKSIICDSNFHEIKKKEYSKLLKIPRTTDTYKLALHAIFDWDKKNR